MGQAHDGSHTSVGRWHLSRNRTQGMGFCMPHSDRPTIGYKEQKAEIDLKLGTERLKVLKTMDVRPQALLSCLLNEGST